MSTGFTAACIQFTAGPDPEPNLRQVGELIRQARAAGAELIMTPEVSNFIESGRRRREKARHEADDPFLAGMRELARETGAWILVGSLVIDPAGAPGADPGEERLANRSFLIDAAGGIVARYDKIHMFDIDLPGGEVLADGGEEVGIIKAQIDPERIAKARGMVPSLQHDRGFTAPERVPLRRAAE